MIISFIDYYLLFVIFFIVATVVLFPNSLFSYSFILNKKKIFNILNLTMLLIKIIKIVICFVLIFLFLGFNFNSDVLPTNDLIFKNFFIFAKTMFFFYFFIFLLIFEYYVKIVNWFNSDVIILLYISVISLYLIFSIDNFFHFYIILEMYSLSIIGCISLKRTNIKSNIESVLKYFFLSAVSSCFILFGISILYANSGLNNFLDFKFYFWMANNNLNFFYCNLGILFFLIGFFIKMSSFPFNYWFIDIYNNISIIFTLFLLIFPKFVFSCFLFLFVNMISFDNYFVNNLILFFSLSTLIINVIISLYQNKIKKLLVITSFSNLPFYVLFAYLLNFYSIVSFFAFFFIYYLNLMAVFIFILMFNNLNFKYTTFYKKIISFKGLFLFNKKLAVMLVSFFLSLAGFPPFSGFFAKFYFLISFFVSGNLILFFLFSIINLILVFVYLRIVKIMFQSKNIYNFKFIKLNSKILIFLFILLFIFNITTVFYFDFIFNFIKYILLALEWKFYL